MTAKILKCFVASPSDVSQERDACDEVLKEINSNLGDQYGFRIESIKWENDAFPDFGNDGQDVLNKQLLPGDHEFFVGIMWKHFGTPTPRAGSGTEEEFNQAYEKWEKEKSNNIQFYFNGRSPESIDDIDHEQLGKVRKFKSDISEKGGLYATYKGLEDFKTKLRSNITKSLLSKYSSVKEKTDESKIDFSRHLSELENKLKYALQSYKGQPEVFVVPAISDSRDLENKNNLLESVIESPQNSLIVAPPQFGLTCLSLHMRVESFKRGNFWVYIEASHMKSRQVLRSIEEQLHHFGKAASDVKCIIIDQVDSSVSEHVKVIRNIDSEYPNIPLIVCTNNDGMVDARTELSLKNRELQVLHLQALSRNRMRNLIEEHNPDVIGESHDEALGELAAHLESINIHRTPLNCLTLLRVNGSGYNEKLLNKTKLMKAILFVLFTDNESFSYLDSKPDVDDCTYVLGKYCRKLVENCSRSFDVQEFNQTLKNICEEELMTLNVDTMIDVLVDNYILIKSGERYEFKHRHWIFYFAAECMFHDSKFREYVLNGQRYTNFPELIDFYTGIDGKRSDVVEVMLSDLKDLVEKVDMKIGIKGEFNPLSKFLWTPSAEYVEKARIEIAEKVESSNLPAEIKDKHADVAYNSEKPYDQSINHFLQDYSVLSLRGSIAASSRALRNSTFIVPELKLQMAQAIIDGWEEISKVIFWISPILAKDGRAAHEGLCFVLEGNFSKDLDQRFRQILTANPMNVIDLVKDDLSSKKIGKILYKLLKQTKSDIQKHFIATFIVEVRPDGWENKLIDHLNRLHPSSFYLGNLLTSLNSQIKLGFIDDDTELQLKRLTGAILAKRRYASKAALKTTKEILPRSMFSDEHKLPIDQLLAKYNPNSPEKYGQSKKK